MPARRSVALDGKLSLNNQRWLVTCAFVMQVATEATAPDKTATHAKIGAASGQRFRPAATRQAPCSGGAGGQVATRAAPSSSRETCSSWAKQRAGPCSSAQVRRSPADERQRADARGKLPAAPARFVRTLRVSSGFTYCALIYRRDARLDVNRFPRVRHRRQHPLRALANRCYWLRQATLAARRSSTRSISVKLPSSLTHRFARAVRTGQMKAVVGKWALLLAEKRASRALTATFALLSCSQ